MDCSPVYKCTKCSTSWPEKWVNCQQMCCLLNLFRADAFQRINILISTNRWLWLIPLQELSLWIMQEINSQSILTHTSSKASRLKSSAVLWHPVGRREGKSTVHMTSQLTESVTVLLTLNTASRSLTRWSCTPCQEWELRVFSLCRPQRSIQLNETEVLMLALTAIGVQQQWEFPFLFTCN